MNIAKFVVLGTLDRLDQASGYDILRELEQKKINNWTNVKKGSVYHALKSMNKNGLIVESDRAKQGLYPTSTLYSITAEGREAFDQMQAEAFLGLFPNFYGFKLALKFNVRRTAEEIEDFANQAITIIDGYLSGMEAYLQTLAKEDPRRQSDPLFIEHDRMLFQQEKSWIEMAVAHTRGTGS